MVSAKLKDFKYAQIRTVKTSVAIEITNV